MIEFHSIDVEVPNVDAELFVFGLTKLLSAENKSLGCINVICVTDDYLLSMNKTHLDHDYYTDIITFDFSENLDVSGDLYISVDRVRDNAVLNEVVFMNEFCRVVVHGVLHLCGYKDKTVDEIVMMREKEDYYLSFCGFT